MPTTAVMRSPVVLVTGASGGIGAAIVREFAKNGYRVALQYHHNAAAAEALATECRAAGADAFTVQADLGDPEQALAAVTSVQTQFGRVEVLVNNAGIAMNKLFLDMTPQDWRTVFSADVDSVFYMSKAVLPGMLREQSGCIINISSMWGMTGASMEVAYSAAKAAVIGLTKALAKELGPSGIRVNCVAPGFIDTPMNRHLSAQEVDDFVQETPLLMLGSPADVAKSCVFLAGEGGRFYTGQVLSPNGGAVI